MSDGMMEAAAEARPCDEPEPHQVHACWNALTLRASLRCPTRTHLGLCCTFIGLQMRPDIVFVNVLPYPCIVFARVQPHMHPAFVDLPTHPHVVIVGLLSRPQVALVTDGSQVVDSRASPPVNRHSNGI
ncbi:hypothetical protein B0H13DRAFT_2317783 [Mycena leptocephala]|nr:hypothetical protein B0H13DRAFT_2317783 [Mycena leptocephala]